MNKPAEVPFPSMLLPSLRAKMGDRWYYVATMTFADIAAAVKPVKEIHEKTELKSWIQRELRPERTAQISDYLRTFQQRFFNAIVLGVYQGEPEWLNVSVAPSVKVKELELGDRKATAFGVIHLSGRESIFAIDGQHRVEGIRASVREKPDLGTEEQAVIFIAHNMTNPGRERTRRLFSTLNTYARPVSESELVALSEDDAFAKVTRQLIETYPGLNIEFVPVLAGANIPATEKTCITTVVGLYHLTQFMASPEIRRAKKTHKIGPASPEVLEEIKGTIAAFWDALKKHVPEIREVCASKPSEQVASKYRHAEGGNILFRTVGMKAFARAARTLMDRGATADESVSRLTKVPLELGDKLWRDVLWQSETKTMLTKYTRLAQNVLLHEIGEQPDGKKVSIPQEYRRITGRKYPG
jgi:DNA sulfur modification protein DndB